MNHTPARGTGTRPTDEEIKEAFLKDVDQLAINGLTPDRHYSTPIDNIKALFAAALSSHAELRRLAEKGIAKLWAAHDALCMAGYVASAHGLKEAAEELTNSLAALRP